MFVDGGPQPHAPLCGGLWSDCISQTPVGTILRMLVEIVINYNTARVCISKYKKIKKKKVAVSATQINRAKTECVFRKCVRWEENDVVEESVYTEIEERGLQERNKLEVTV